MPEQRAPSKMAEMILSYLILHRYWRIGKPRLSVFFSFDPGERPGGTYYMHKSNSFTLDPWR